MTFPGACACRGRGRHDEASGQRARAGRPGICRTSPQTCPACPAGGFRFRFFPNGVPGCLRPGELSGHALLRSSRQGVRQGVSFRGRPKRRRRVSICRKHRLPGRRRRLFQRPDNALRSEFMTERWQRGAEAAERGKTYAVVKMPFGGRRNRRRPW